MNFIKNLALSLINNLIYYIYSVKKYYLSLFYPHYIKWIKGKVFVFLINQIIKSNNSYFSNLI